MRFLPVVCVVVACSQSALDGDLETHGASRPGGFRADHEDLAAADGEELVFAVTVPAGATRLTAATRGGTGDADLIVRAGDAVLCVSDASGNDEWCEVGSPPAGIVEIVLHAYSAFAGVELDVEVTGGASDGWGPEVLDAPTSEGDLRIGLQIHDRHGALEWTVTPNDPGQPYHIFLTGGSEWCQEMHQTGVQVCRMVHPVAGSWRAETYEMAGGGAGVLTWTPFPLFVDTSLERPWGDAWTETTLVVPPGASAVIEAIGTDPDGALDLEVSRNGTVLCDLHREGTATCRLEGVVQGELQVRVGGFDHDAFTVRGSVTSGG